MVVLVLSCITFQLPSFVALLDAMAEGRLPGLASLDVTRQAFSQRLAAISHTSFLELFRSVTRLLSDSPHKRPWVAPLAPFANGIYGIDDTTLDALAKKVDWLRAMRKGAPETLAGRLSALVDLTTGKLREVIYDDDSAANERNHLFPTLASLPEGAMLVFDLGYFGFHIFDALTERKLHFVTRMKANISYEVGHVFADRPHYRDRLVYLGTHKTDRAAHPVRLVEVRIDQVWWRYITNVLEPAVFPAQHVWALYLERWTLETTFAAIKVALGLGTLHSSASNALLIQIWSTLTLYQVLQDLRLDIALSMKWKAEDVSWTNLMRRIGSYATLPTPKPSLREWLRTRAEKQGVQKRGTRVRRLRQLPDDVLADIQQALSELPAPLPSRQAKGVSRKRFERKKPPLLTVGQLMTEHVGEPRDTER